MAENELPNGQPVDGQIGDRSTYPEGHEVHQKDLAYTQSAIINNLLRRFADSSRPGVAFGLTVQRSTLVTSRVDISVDPGRARGWAYTPAGHLIEITSSQLNIGLADYTDAAINLICAVYTEVESEPSAHETQAIIQNTRAARSFRIRAYTQAEYDLLQESDPDLGIDAKDRIAILGIALGNGSTLGVPNALVTTEVTQQAPFTETLTAARTSVHTVLGVEIIDISSQTNLASNAQLRLICSAGPTFTLAWAAPGDSFGVAVTITADGNFSLTSSNATDTIVAKVVFSLLPLINGTYTDTYTIGSIYQDVAPRWSARDHLHASKTGSGLPTENNPHGIDASDLGSNVVDFPQVIRLGTGYQATELQALTPRITTVNSTAAGVDRTLQWEVPPDVANLRGGIRFYSSVTDGNLEIANNCRWNGTQWIKDLGANSDASIFTVRGGFMSFATHESGAIPGPNFTDTDISLRTLWSTSVPGADEAANPQGLFRFENYLDTNLKSIRPRIDTKYNPSASFYTLLWQSSPSVVSTTTGTTRFYVNGTGELHITRNARWDGALWNRDILSEATLLEIGSGEFFFRRQNFNAVPWANGAWTQIILGGDLDGVFTQGLGITADANGSMDPNFARFNAPFNFNTGDATGNRLQVLRAYDSSDSLGFHEYAHAFNVGFDFEKTIGCHWNHANNSWEQDNASAGSAVCWRFGNGAMARFMKNPTIETWLDTQWTSCDRAFAEIIIANGAPTIVAGFNIASITNISATTARINFTTPLPSDNYIVLATSIGNAFDVITPTVRLTTFVEIQPARSSFPGNLVFGNFTTQNWRFSISMQAT